MCCTFSLYRHATRKAVSETPTQPRISSRKCDFIHTSAGRRNFCGIEILNISISIGTMGRDQWTGPALFDVSTQNKYLGSYHNKSGCTCGSMETRSFCFLRQNDFRRDLRTMSAPDETERSISWGCNAYHISRCALIPGSNCEVSKRIQ